MLIDVCADGESIDVGAEVGGGVHGRPHMFRHFPVFHAMYNHWVQSLHCIRTVYF